MSQRRTKRLSEDNSALLHQVMENTKSLMAIGSANKRWINLIYELANNADSVIENLSARYGNVDGTDCGFIFGVPLPYIIGGYNLVITQTKMGIYDAANNDEVDRLRWVGFTDFETQSTFLDTGAGYDLQPEQEDTWNHADTTIGGVYERIALLVNVIVTNAGGLDISYAQVEYYYG